MDDHDSAPHLAVRTGDRDEAEWESARIYYPLKLRLLEPGARFDMEFRALRLGPLTLGELGYGAEVGIWCGELESAYHVNIPMSGQLESEHRGERVLATPRLAAVYQPRGNTHLRRWASDCRQWCLKIDRGSVERELQALTGTPVRGAVDMGASLDLTTGASRSWLGLIQLLAAQIGEDDSILQHSLVAEQLWHSVITGLLLSVDHSYQHQLRRPVPASRPRVVKRAIDAIENHPARPFTSIELAEIAGASVRSLQAGFHEHVGMSPMAYVREVRLERVHQELLGADPSIVSVADVALRWGFSHLGRFAGMYRKKYGCSPSDSLRYG
jgi:AraC-like DNA-binding protein